MSALFKVNIYIQWNIFDRRPCLPQGLLLPSVQFMQQQAGEKGLALMSRAVTSLNFLFFVVVVYWGLLDPLSSCYCFFLIMFSRIKKAMFLFLFFFFFFFYLKAIKWLPENKAVWHVGMMLWLLIILWCISEKCSALWLLSGRLCQAQIIFMKCRHSWG